MTTDIALPALAKWPQGLDFRDWKAHLGTDHATLSKVIKELWDSGQITKKKGRFIAKKSVTQPQHQRRQTVMPPRKRTLAVLRVLSNQNFQIANRYDLAAKCGVEYPEVRQFLKALYRAGHIVSVDMGFQTVVYLTKSGAHKIRARWNERMQLRLDEGMFVSQ
jgi:predicted transcriptional regulator